MADTLTHRGPDDADSWVDPATGVALAFRRLAILDLTPTGRQPMQSADGRFVLAFNGEAYNFAALRAELEAKGVRFRGRSDTEVLLEGISTWGFAATLERVNGMFALACWDRSERRLLLARDRFGEKPLYYGWFGTTFLFGSELKALRSHPAFAADVDRDVLAKYLQRACVPAPHTIYTGVSKLEPGTWLSMDPDQPGTAHVERFWSPIGAALEAMTRASSPTPEEAADAVEHALTTSIGLRMVADVPVGAFLSGGTDSSLVVALMQAQSTMPVRTYTIAFDAAGYDEAEQAKAVAAHLGTEHTELSVTPAEMQAVVPRLATMYDEPFADSSQIPTFLVAQLARGDVTVALSGDGGDELFGGYTRYLAFERLRRLARIPRVARLPFAAVLRSQPPQRWDRVVRGTTRVVRRRPPAQPGDKLHKLARSLSVAGPGDVWSTLTSCWVDPPVVGAATPTGPDLGPSAHAIDGVEWAMLADTASYLHDDLLVKVDRATMAVSLEARVPMLDPNVFDVAWSLPLDAKVRGARGKRVLTDVLARHVPDTIVGGPKTGFGVPFGEWLRGPLRSWADDLLAADRLRNEGFLDAPVVERRWREHRAGSHDHRHELWAVLMFESWLETATTA